ncbi:hypothetical protein GJ744_005682 [Endocarpon pusillum]|uniref:Uncharacterized protein n=1 Tax=Endocarpon pusillum TaxID=364733 RepID=A0A8H7DY95_9EURO|nr:hypothetical protein GJ744_005682 [Endocarpon pusillum]
MLAAIQHYKPVLNGLADTLALVNLADKYVCLPAVSRAVRLHLIECGGNTSDLYRNIARDPVDYLYIGEKTRSSIITKEAATHVLGTWSETKTRCQELISSQLFNSLARIHDELRLKKERANKALLSLNYEPLIAVRVDSMEEAGAALILVRENISNAYYNCLRHSNPERFEGNLYREITRSANVQKPYLGLLRRSASQTSFEDSCIILGLKIGDAAFEYARAMLD